MECYEKGGELMKKVVWVIVAVLCFGVSSAFTVNVSIKGYDGEAILSVVSENFNTSYRVKLGSVISLPEGEYIFRLFALNKTFEKRVNVSENATITFNLLFTNNKENLSITRHVIIHLTTQIEVHEIVLITNLGDVNFEGDLTLPLPEYTNLRVEEYTLSFINVDDDGERVKFVDLLVPANDSGRISYTYRLKSNVFEIKNNENRIILLSALPVEKYENVSYKGTQNFGGQEYEVFEGNSSRMLLIFSTGGKVNINPLAVAGILLLSLSVSVFLYLRGRSGGWEA